MYKSTQNWYLSGMNVYFRDGDTIVKPALVLSCCRP